MKKERKSRAFNQPYASPRQLELAGFETPFSRTLNPDNRWVILAKMIPLDEICSHCRRHLGNTGAGRKPLNPRIVIGSLIIKYMLNLDDRETVSQISEKHVHAVLLGLFEFHRPIAVWCVCVCRFSESARSGYHPCYQWKDSEIGNSLGGEKPIRWRKTTVFWQTGFIFLVLNLVKLAGVALPCLILKLLQNLVTTQPLS